MSSSLPTAVNRLASLLRPRLRNFVAQENHSEWIDPSWEFVNRGIRAQLIKPGKLLNVVPIFRPD